MYSIEASIDYDNSDVSAEVEISGIDAVGGILKTKDASTEADAAQFTHLQSFNKITVSPAVKTLKIFDGEMNELSVESSGNTTDFYVALPGGESQIYTFLGIAADGKVYGGNTKTKALTNGEYYKTSGSITLNSSLLTPASSTTQQQRNPLYFMADYNYDGGTASNPGTTISRSEA